MSVAFTTSVNSLTLTLTNTTTPVAAGYPNYNRYIVNWGDGTSETMDYPTLNPSPHVYGQAGNYSVSLVAQSLVGQDVYLYGSVYKTVAIGGATANVAPTAAFTAVLIKTYTDGSQLWGFDASGSSDPDGFISQYSWTWGDGSSYSGKAGALNHTFARSGSYTVRLTVYDNNLKASTVVATTINVGTRLA